MERKTGPANRKMEEHIVLLRVPGPEYLGHVSVEEGSSATIQRTMFQLVIDNNINLSLLKAIDADRTNINTSRSSIDRCSEFCAISTSCH
jgi:hypothetical protein